MLGFTKFDPCLCGDETGYFMVEVMQAAGPPGPTALRIGMAGRYRIQSRQVQLIGEAGETRASPEGETSIYLVRDQTRSFDNGRFRIDVARWFPVFICMVVAELDLPGARAIEVLRAPARED